MGDRVTPAEPAAGPYESVSHPRYWDCGCAERRGKWVECYTHEDAGYANEDCDCSRCVGMAIHAHAWPEPCTLMCPAHAAGSDGA